MIGEEEFAKLCEDLFKDRKSIVAMAMGMAAKDAVLWLLYGSLVSLLDIPLDHDPGVRATGDNPYRSAIEDLLRDRMSPPFDAAHYIDGLIRRIEDEGLFK